MRDERSFLRARWRSYALFAAVACVFALVPVLLVQAASGRTPSRVERLLFDALVEPPSFVAERLTGDPTVYGQVFGLYVADAAAVLPPSECAVDHLQVAVPFWFIAFAVVYELGRRVRTLVSAQRSFVDSR